MSNNTPPCDANQPNARRLKLVLKTSDHDLPNHSNTNTVVKDASSSPPRPSYSPVTPTQSHTSLVSQRDADAQLIDESPRLPVSLDDNADAIALKATISLLQMQRQKGLRDIKQLDKMRDAALENPEAFVDDLRTGKLKPRPRRDIDLDEDEDEDESLQDAANSIKPESHFGTIPTSQNVARCPPIEWSKYNILGQPLEALHELQRRYPGLTEHDFGRGVQPEPTEILAPYRPFIDKLEPKRNEDYNT